jgi:hypothetical protein
VGGASTSAILTQVAGLSQVAGAGRPIVLARERLIDIPTSLAGMLPEGGLRRGSTLTLAAGGGAGCTSLALALIMPVTQSGSWVAAVGLPSLGLVAAVQLGASLDRLALVPAAGASWPVVVAALLESVDVVLLVPSGRVQPSDARRLSAKARERGAVLVVLQPAGAPSARWPEAADLHLTVGDAHWEGLGHGSGHLRSRVLDVVSSGRRAASRPRIWRVTLPGPDGQVGLAPVSAGADAGSESAGSELDPVRRSDRFGPALVG